MCLGAAEYDLPQVGVLRNLEVYRSDGNLGGQFYGISVDPVLVPGKAMLCTPCRDIGAKKFH